MSISKVLSQVTDRYIKKGITPYEINNGYCDDWSQKVFTLLEHKKCRVEIWETPFGLASTNHVFVRINGKFYDAECLEGADDHMDLPIFHKLELAGEGRQPVWCMDSNRECVESRRDMTHEMLVEYDEIYGTNNASS